MISARGIEKLAQGLTVVSFVVVCWVTHRTMQERTQCVSSSYLSFVQIGPRRIENCRNESRLSFAPLLHPLTQDQAQIVRALEVLEPLTDVLPQSQPKLAVEINLEAPHIFELGKGYIRLGREWLSDELQTRRALIMGVLNRDPSLAGDFQLEVMTDFLLTSVMSQTEWQGHSLLNEVKFPTTAPQFADYCHSPFRSLRHAESCALEMPEGEDMQSSVWGFRPLIVAALARVFDKVSLANKFDVLHGLKANHSFLPIPVLGDDSIDGRVQWFERTMREQVRAFGFRDGADTDMAIKRTLKELDVSAPTHWELTVDITNTPAWKEVLEQFRTWSRLHPHERVLVFTPEGNLALPSGLPVAWSPEEVQSQKHVLIACHWPKAEDALPVTARHMFVRQLCGKVDQVFWN